MLVKKIKFNNAMGLEKNEIFSWTKLIIINIQFLINLNNLNV